MSRRLPCACCEIDRLHLGQRLVRPDANFDPGRSWLAPHMASYREGKEEAVAVVVSGRLKWLEEIGRDRNSPMRYLEDWLVLVEVMRGLWYRAESRLGYSGQSS